MVGHSDETDSNTELFKIETVNATKPSVGLPDKHKLAIKKQLITEHTNIYLLKRPLASDGAMDVCLSLSSSWRTLYLTLLSEKVQAVGGHKVNTTVVAL